jgi:hypothetical protein
MDARSAVLRTLLNFFSSAAFFLRPLLRNANGCEWVEKKRLKRESKKEKQQ